MVRATHASIVTLFSPIVFCRGETVDIQFARMKDKVTTGLTGVASARFDAPSAPSGAHGSQVLILAADRPGISCFVQRIPRRKNQGLESRLQTGRTISPI